MAEPPLFLDVNVPMYAAGGDHPHKAACVWIMTELTAGRLNVVIDTAIIQEILYRFGALKSWARGTALAGSLLTLVPDVLPVGRAEIADAVALFGRFGPDGVSARDVLHVAVMRRHGIDEILSTDLHFDRLPGITRREPQALFDGRPGRD
jgi:predicted nucleic acid-binding protein